MGLGYVHRSSVVPIHSHCVTQTARDILDVRDSSSAQTNETSHAQGGFGAGPPQAQSNPPSLTTNSIPCRHIGGVCSGFTEEDISRGVPGVRQHLWQFHRNNLLRDAHGKYVCQWLTSTGHTCAMAISDLDNLARHMASVHLKLTVQKCPTCGSQFSRADALLRHCRKCG